MITNLHSCLILKVEPVPGTRIEDTFVDACELAYTLGLAWVEFPFNNLNCTAYPNDHGLAHETETGKVYTWTPETGLKS